MKTISTIALGLSLLGVAAAGACGGTASGHLILGVKDGPPISSDGRTISSLQIDITRIKLSQDEEKNMSSSTAASQSEDVVVFDAGTGAAHTIDLLKVTTFSELVASLQVRAGTYDGAELTVTGARVVFADAPSATIDLALEGDGHHKAEFEFKFKPKATVSLTGTTVAVVDFVPVVTKDGATYRLGHDGENDQSGESGDHNEIEMSGKIATLDLAGKTLTLDNGVAKVDFSAAMVKQNHADALLSALAVGQSVEVEGALDRASLTLVAKEITIK